MPTKRRTTLRTMFASIAFLALAGCGGEDGVGPSSRPPVAGEIQIPADVVIVGDVVIVSVECSDPDGDAVTVEWSPAPIVQTRNEATYGAAIQLDVVGTQEIAATCSSADGSATARASISVIPGGTS